jgi:drug/metabolite transporter (DMT)-like permease
VTRVAPRSLPYFAVAVAACLWGTWALVLRHAEAIGPIPTALESAVVLAVLTGVAGLVSLRDRIAKPATWRARGWVAFLGVADAFNVMLLFAAYKIAIAVSVLSHYLTPIFVAIAAPLLLRERLTARTGAAIVASFGGLAIMLAPASGAGTRPAAAALLTAAALGAGSAFFYASNVIVTKFVMTEFSTSETMFWHGLIATPLLILFVPGAAWSGISVAAVVFLAVASLLPGTLAGLLFVWGLRRMPAAHASALTLLEPLVAVIVGSLVFGEALGPRAALGGALILGGALTVMSQRRGDAREETAQGTANA